MQALTIGQPHPEHGDIYAGIIRNHKTGEQHHLYMHPQALPKTPWGKYGHEIEDASCYWDGTTNTAAMRASGQCAEIIAALDALPNANRYYIPAQREQNLLTCNLADMLAPEWHWSSTQYSAGSAWIQGCEHGSQGINLKDHRLAVRAVRRELVIE